MTRVRCSLGLTVAFVLGVAFSVAAAQAAERGARSGRGGFGGASSRTLTGLLGREEVQKELKLTDEQKEKVAEIAKKLGAEMRAQYAGLREITDTEKRAAKMAELRDQQDTKAREALAEVISREQLMRLYQIRIQVNGTVYALSNRFVARMLKLTDEQKEKVAAIDKSTQQKQREASAGLRGASQEARTEAMAKLRKLRQAADEEALALLTAEQKEGLEKVKGDKFELQRRSRQ